MDRPRAADDFDIIHERLKELRRERELSDGDAGAMPSGRSDEDEDEDERRRRECCDGVPPPWVPTIFLPQPTD